VDDRGELEDSRRVGNFELYDFPKEAVAPTLNARRAKDELVYGDGPLSFPSRFGSNAQVTDGIAQSFAHSAGAPAVLQTGTSYDGFNQRLEPDGPHRTLRIGRDSSDFVVPPNGIPEDDDPFNPIGLDSNRYRCIGNGVVAPVAEFIGRRIVAVDAKYWKEANA
jgi:site-specific DNA-cytosine methylase